GKLTQSHAPQVVELFVVVKDIANGPFQERNALDLFEIFPRNPHRAKEVPPSVRVVVPAGNKCRRAKPSGCRKTHAWPFGSPWRREKSRADIARGQMLVLNPQELLSMWPTLRNRLIDTGRIP